MHIYIAQDYEQIGTYNQKVYRAKKRITDFLQKIAYCSLYGHMRTYLLPLWWVEYLILCNRRVEYLDLQLP